MRSNRRADGLWTGSALLGAALMTVGVAALAQQPRPPQQPGANADKKVQRPVDDAPKPKGGLRLQPGEPPKDGDAPAADPLAGGAAPAAGAAAAAPGQGQAPAAAPGQALPPLGPVVPEWPFHYRLQLQGFDGTALGCRYYPSRLGVSTPVVLLVHESGPGRSGKDFEDPIAELDNQGLAEHLQELGYAVLVLDLRGHGTNPRQTLNDARWRAKVADLQAAYQFLLDRHNRRELNVAKLGVVALGDGANLALAWASMPAAAVAVEGRISDLGALALVSPLPEAHGVRATPAVRGLAPRIPILLMAGQDDAASAAAVQEARPAVDRQRLSVVACCPPGSRGPSSCGSPPRRPSLCSASWRTPSGSGPTSGSRATTSPPWPSPTSSWWIPTPRPPTPRRPQPPTPTRAGRRPPPPPTPPPPRP